MDSAVRDMSDNDTRHMKGVAAIITHLEETESEGPKTEDADTTCKLCSAPRRFRCVSSAQVVWPSCSRSFCPGWKPIVPSDEPPSMDISASWPIYFW